MKKFSKFIVLVLASVLALTLLTACDSETVSGVVSGTVGGTTKVGADADGVVRAMNAARAEASLGKVESTNALNEKAKEMYALKNWADRSTIIINGQNYTVYFMESYAISSGAVRTEEGWKTAFKSEIEEYNKANSGWRFYVGHKDLKYVGVWAGKDDQNQNSYCIIGAFPEDVNPNEP